jgi:hypothetical protein
MANSSGSRCKPHLPISYPGIREHRNTGMQQLPKPAIKAGFVAVKLGVDLLSGGLSAPISPTGLVILDIAALASAAEILPKRCYWACSTRFIPYMSEYGKQLVLIGAGDIAIGNVAKGFLEVGAGLALSFGAGAAKGAFGGASGGASSAKPTSPTTNNVGQNSNIQTVKVIAEFRLRGQDLVAVSRSADYRSSVTD